MVDVIVEVRSIGLGPNKINTARVERIILTMHKELVTKKAPLGSKPTKSKSCILFNRSLKTLLDSKAKANRLKNCEVMKLEVIFIAASSV